MEAIVNKPAYILMQVRELIRNVDTLFILSILPHNFCIDSEIYIKYLNWKAMGFSSVRTR